MAIERKSTLILAIGGGLIVVLLTGIAFLGYEVLRLRQEQELVRIENARKEEVARVEAARKEEAAKAEAAKKEEEEKRRAAITPKVVGYYIVSDGRLAPLQRLTESKKLAFDLGDVYLDKPTLSLKAGPVLRIVVYDRQKAMFGEPIVMNIMANVKDNTDWWKVRNFGFKLNGTPRADNRDILDVYWRPPPGRYAVESPLGLFTIHIEGEVKDADHCLVSKRMFGALIWEKCS